MREYLKELRTNKSITQAEISEVLGISQNHYSNIENGARVKVLDLHLLNKLAEFYEVPLSQLINEELMATKEGA